MSWKEENAIKRIFNLFNRLSNKLFKEDIEALKTINESLDFYKIRQISDNKIYAKVLIILIKERYFRFNDINSALQSIDKELGLSIEYQLEFLTANIRNNELCEYIKTLKIDVSDSDLNNVDALTKKESELFDIHQKEIFAEIKNLWNSDHVSDCFYNSANQFLNDIKNYK